MPRIPHPSLACFALVTALFLPVVAGAQPAGVFVGNQGNFSDANGGVSYIDLATLDVTVDAIPGLNTLVQSVALHEGVGYVMANTSDRIDVFSTETRARTGQILEVTSPRYMAVVGGDKAYVSNLFDNTVTIVRLSDATVLGTLPTGANPEAIAVAGGRAYVANSGFGAGTTLTVLDPETDAALGALEVGCDGPRMLAVDAQDELWVMCTGNTVYNDDFTEIVAQTNGQVVVFDGATGDAVARFEAGGPLGSGTGGQEMFYDDVSERVVVVQGGSLLVFDAAFNAPLPPVRIAGAETIGAVTYDGVSGRYLLGRFSSFTEAGFVSLHDALGVEVGRVAVGIAPTSLAIDRRGANVATTPLPDGPGLPALQPAYPNPFTSSTTLGFTLDTPGTVRLEVINALGQVVAVLADGAFPPGTHEVAWSPAELAPGLYVGRLNRDGAVSHRTLVALGSTR